MSKPVFTADGAEDAETRVTVTLDPTGQGPELIFSSLQRERRKLEFLVQALEMDTYSKGSKIKSPTPAGMGFSIYRAWYI